MKKYKDTLNLTDEDLAVIPAWQKEWQEVYLPTANRDNCTLAQIRKKNQKKKEITLKLRAFIRAKLLFNPGMTDGMRIEFDLPVRRPNSPAPVPATDPFVHVAAGDRFAHILTFRTEENGRRNKPHGVRGIRLYRKFNQAPQHNSDLDFFGEFTRSKITVNYTFDDNGKTAFYVARWVNTKGEAGPWNNIVSKSIS
ncbi:hypothetical protein Barb6XT_02255 [Bacteroidales bacterium Barb6XT]|nr:hypothetical protein Barb6XT_02255 [Bacteroidales bacterium Barb6XT]